jgi:site-specific DNA recombinase
MTTVNKKRAGIRSAVIYIKQNLVKQVPDYVSVEKQMKILRQYSKSKRLYVLQEFVDMVPAWQLCRNEFKAMVQFLKKHPDCKVLVVEKYDSLCRNFRDWIDLDDLKMEIHYVEEKRVYPDPANPENNLQQEMRVLSGRYFSAKLSEAIKTGLRKKKRCERCSKGLKRRKTIAA